MREEKPRKRVSRESLRKAYYRKRSGAAKPVQSPPSASFDEDLGDYIIGGGIKPYKSPKG